MHGKPPASASSARDHRCELPSPNYTFCLNSKVKKSHNKLCKKNKGAALQSHITHSTYNLARHTERFCTCVSKSTHHFLFNFIPKEQQCGKLQGWRGKGNLPVDIPGHPLTPWLFSLLPFSIYINSKTLTDNEDTELSALSASAKEAK